MDSIGSGELQEQMKARQPSPDALAREGEEGARTALLVLGMHRSGTSALTRMIGLIGGGLPKRVLPATEFNATGYWEPARIVALNDELLAACGSRWDDWRLDPLTQISPVIEQRMLSLLVQIVQQEYVDCPIIAIKDPRICRLVSFYDRALARIGAEPRYILTYRHPDEVAESLNARDGMATDYAKLMWLGHVISAERQTRGKPRSIVSYDLLLQDWRQLARKMAAELELPWLVDFGSQEGEIDRFLDRDLRHYQRSLDTSSQAGGLIVRAYASLVALHADAGNEHATRELDSIFDELRAAENEFVAAANWEELFSRNLREQAKDEHFRLELADRQGELEALRLRAAEADILRSELQRLRVLETEAAAMRTEIEVLRSVASEVADLRLRLERHQELASELRKSEGKLSALRAGHLRAMADHSALRREFEERTERLRRQRANLELRERELQEARRELTAIKRTISWRIAGSVRWAVEELPRLTGAAITLAYWTITGQRRRQIERRRTLRAQAAKLMRSGLFDAKWYRAVGPASASEENPALHYLTKGAKLGIDPHPLFSTRWYREQYDSQESPIGNPLLDFINNGAGKGRRPHPLFDTAWYLRTYGEALAPNLNPLLDYVQEGARKGRDPNPGFESGWYLRRYREVAERNGNPLLDYILNGESKGRDPGPLFDRAFYLDRNPDVREAGVDPLQHYLEHGRAEARATFDSGKVPSPGRVAVVVHLFYLELWPELVRALANIPVPFTIFVTVPDHGTAQFRKLVQRRYPDAVIVPCPNRGRDLGPFLSVLPQVADGGFSAVCKIHTKKGGTEPATWRRLLLQSVLGSENLVWRILHEFASNPRLQLIGAKEFYVSAHQYMGENERWVKTLSGDLFGSTRIEEDWGFFAGSMFWVRPEILVPLAEAVSLRHAFEADNAINDGLLAHAIERFIGLIPARTGGAIGLVDLAQRDRELPPLDVIEAPGVPSRAAIAEYLAAAASAKDQRPVLRSPRPLRQWRAPHDVELGVNFVGPLDFINGLGVSARGYLKGIQAAHLPHSIIPWYEGFERLKKIPVPFERSVRDHAVNLIHLNLDLLTKSRALDREPLDDLVTPARYNIALIAWELMSIRPEWSDVMSRFDEIWCPSSFMARAISAVFRGRVRVVRPALAHTDEPPRFTRIDLGLPVNRFLFFYAADAGSVVGRKNPLAFVEAYCDTFSPNEGAGCVVKLHYASTSDPEVKKIRDLAEARADVTFLDSVVSDEEMRALFQHTDAYVSPHRSEGLGLTILEAMYAGKPVIATEYGGVADFVSAETGFPVPYRLVEVGPGNDPYPPTYVWAEPDASQLRSAMRKVFSDREEAARRAEAGRQNALRLFGVEVIAGQLRAEIDRIRSVGQPETGLAPAEQAA